MSEPNPKNFDLENGATVAQLPDGQFTELQIDFDEHCLFAVGEVAGIGEMRVSFAIPGFSSDLSFGEPDEEGNAPLNAEHRVSIQDLHDGIAQIDELNQRWEFVWPTVLEAILEARAECECATAPTPRNCRIQISAPGLNEGDDSGDWICDLTLRPSDGNFYVYFSLDGEVLDAGAEF
ncbi:hypothetical protein [Cerasicoccus frondis]|uniref:hypothetical protein n=1 Tax=Cerasicoccus frondis TaxID=490090 RepID=UPI0028528356|nr:hypothetical protein [Cerasicoccus frondis]